jgi:putative phosphotransacetylase
MKKIMVETSAHHLHVTAEAFKTLFGEGKSLTNKKNLSQPGQFACEEKVTVVGPKGSITMSILGPFRNDNQIEISMTETRKLGVAPFIRESGDIAGTPGCILKGPEGEVEVDHGVIVAKRHMHMTPEAAAEYGVEDKQIVKVAVGGMDRKLIFDDVVVRVSPKFFPAVHLDTDEANAAGLAGTVDGEIIL